jgi:hypothetical protein
MSIRFYRGRQLSVTNVVFLSGKNRDDSNENVQVRSQFKFLAKN